MSPESRNSLQRKMVKRHFKTFLPRLSGAGISIDAFVLDSVITMWEWRRTGLHQKALANTKTTTARRTFKTGAKQRPTLFFDKEILSSRTWRRNFFVFLNMVPKNSIAGKITYIWHTGGLEIIAMKLERWRIHFISDIFAVGAVFCSLSRTIWQRYWFLGVLFV